MMRLKFVILLLVWLQPMYVAAQDSVAQSQDMYFGVRLTPELVEWFNQTAGPLDVAGVMPQEVALLSQVTTGRKQVLFTSVAQAEELLPQVGADIDMIGYDLEHWAATPATEQSDPITAVLQMRQLADEYHLLLGIGPDREFALQYGAQLAPYVDQFTLQVQRLQANPQRFRAFANGLMADLRAANPEIQLVVQVRTEGNMEDVLALVNSLEEPVNGVGILYTPATLAKMQELAGMVQQSELITTQVTNTAVAPAEETVAVGETAVSLPPSLTPTPTQVMIPTVPPALTPAPLPTPTPTSVICVSPLGMVVGIGITAVFARRRGAR